MKFLEIIYKKCIFLRNTPLIGTIKVYNGRVKIGLLFVKLWDKAYED
jgi:hypothetical protein